MSKKFGKIQLRVLHEVAVSDVELRQCTLEPLGTGSSRNVGPVFSGSCECLHLDSTCGLVFPAWFPQSSWTAYVLAVEPDFSSSGLQQYPNIVKITCVCMQYAYVHIFLYVCITHHKQK